MTLDDLPDWVSANDLALYDITPADVRRLCPHARERTGLDGSPCWHRYDLGPLFDEEGGDLP
jgi:hypothetical protein